MNKERIGARALVAFWLLTASGCSTTERINLRPVYDNYESPGTYRPAVLYSIPEDASEPLLVMVSSFGIERNYRDGAARARFEFRLSNDSGQLILLPVSDFRIQDDEGNISGPPILEEIDRQADKPVSIQPNGKGAFGLSFYMNGLIDPDRLGSLKLNWLVSFGDTKHERTTKFIRFEIHEHTWPYPYRYIR